MGRLHRQLSLAALLGLLLPAGDDTCAAESGTAGISEPRRTGWPLTAEERAYVVDKPEHERRPGRDSGRHLPALWPVVPTAGHFGGVVPGAVAEGDAVRFVANPVEVDGVEHGLLATVKYGVPGGSAYKLLNTRSTLQCNYKQA